jgi:double zinc ribbon protein
MPLCPACKTDVPVGHFCSNCSATLQDMPCSRCNAVVATGSRYCHNCGAAAASAALAAALMPLERAPSSRIPWIIGGTATAALLVLIIAQQLNTNASPNAASGTQSAEAPPAGMRAPDISQMTPRERASRLFDRIMRLNEEGKRDSVALFATMAVPAFQSLEPLDAHLRYDLGRIAAVAGMLDLAKAEADTVLKAQPRHLLGLILAAQVAQLNGDAAAALRFNNQLVASEASERAKGLEEYTLHDADIRTAIAAARQPR